MSTRILFVASLLLLPAAALALPPNKGGRQPVAGHVAPQRVIPVRPAFTAHPTHPRPPLVVPSPPPLPRPVAALPRAPSRHHVWVPGYWRWQRRAWSWTPGVWLMPPLPRSVWFAPFWYPSPTGMTIVVAGRWIAPQPVGELYAPMPPPAPLLEAVPPAPASYMVWIDGYWVWQAGGFRWVAGRWEIAPFGYAWEPPIWIQEDNHWRFIQGGWRR